MREIVNRKRKRGKEKERREREREERERERERESVQPPPYPKQVPTAPTADRQTIEADRPPPPSPPAQQDPTPPTSLWRSKGVVQGGGEGGEGVKAATGEQTRWGGGSWRTRPGPGGGRIAGAGARVPMRARRGDLGLKPPCLSHGISSLVTYIYIVCMFRCFYL